MNTIEIQYLTDNGKIRTVRAYRIRDTAIDRTDMGGGIFTFHSRTVYLEYEGPSGTGFIEKSKILTISRKLDKREMLK